VVAREILKYRRGSKGQPWHFLDFSQGRGSAITNEMDQVESEEDMVREEQVLESPEILAIKGLGQFQRFRAASLFRRLIENWHVSDFHIEQARPSQEAGVAEHLSVAGDNLSLVAQFLFERHRRVFDEILRKMSQRVPGVTRIDAEPTVDGRIVLRFQDGAFKDPFIAKYVSDGTIKMFAYLVLLYDPAPHPLLCVEEPENQLYPRLLDELAEEFREYAGKGGQVMVSTHSPDFLNAVKLEEVFWLWKKDGYTQVRRAMDVEPLGRLIEEGDALGSLWKQGFFEGADPT
jgi:predicted ATPase